jgi:hypothetical protein
MSERVRERQRSVERPPHTEITVGPPAKLVEGLAVAIKSEPAIYEKDVEKGAKIALALIMYYDPSTNQWYPATSPRGIPEVISKAYKPDTNSFEYLRLDHNYYLLVKEYSLLTPVYNQLIGADETVAQSIVLDTEGRSLVSVYAVADAATTFHLDGSNDNVNWFNDLATYSGVTKVNDVVQTAFRYVRLRSDAAGVAGSTVTLVLAAKVG